MRAVKKIVVLGRSLAVSTRRAMSSTSVETAFDTIESRAMGVLAELLGDSPGIVAVRDKVARLLENPSEGWRPPAVFIEGETGTGKTILARSMHRASPRRERPFIEINCSAVPETLAEAQMFGHERGAYTDAREARPGLFQLAHTGTLFLDDVTLMSPGLQAKLLKAIEEKTVRRVGGTRTESVDVWVIAASNENLVAAVQQGRFREDLYHRLARVVLRLPPLRERGNDILLLAEQFLERACREHRLPPRCLDATARGALLAHDWRGNVRQLDNVMERVALFADTEVITARALELTPRREAGSDEGVVLTGVAPTVDRERLLAVLEEVQGNLSRAAARLGMPRNTLRYRLKQLGLLPEGARRARPTPAQASPPSPTTWEPRRLALLRVESTTPAPGHFSSVGSWIDTVVGKVEVFGGRVLERSGTGVVAAFGLEPVEDAPGRAAYTAVALHRAAERVRSVGQEVRVRLAIDVRRCQVDFGRDPPALDPNAKRETWARLDALGASVDPDTTAVSETAKPFLDRRFELAAVAVPGSAQHGAYRLVGHGRPGLGRGGRNSTFVGRHANLDLLRDHLRRVTLGQGAAVGIVGDAGIGKSRLIAEFRASLAADEVIYLEGACLSYAGAIPYVPLLAILRQIGGIGESDSAAAITTSLRQCLASLDMNVEESAPYLFELVGLREGTERLAQLTPEAIRRRTLEILRQMFLGSSTPRPVVLVIEDVHWVDKASEEVLASVAAGLPGARVLFLSTYRPGFRPPWMDRSFATQMALSPLSPEDSQTMLRSVLEANVPDSVVRMIVDKAEGNPFFLEEISQTVEGQSDPETMPAVPDTIEEVLLSRIERLPEGPRGVLHSAAVLGREFSWPLLEAAWHGPGALEAHVALLTDLEFLYQRAGSRERVHLFKHSLTQQVAYTSLPPARRRELHAAAGRALEALFADRLEEAYDRLAHHYSKTEEAAKAVDYLHGFAEKAARGDAREEAVDAWQEALQHVERLPPDVRDRRRLEILLSLCGSLLPLGRIAEGLALLLPRRDYVENLRDAALAAHYYFLLARFYMLGDHTRVVDSVRRAIAAAERAGDDATRGGAYGVLAVACVLSGQAEKGIDCGQQAVGLLERTTNLWSLGYAFWALGLCHSQLGNFQSALAAQHRSTAIAQAIGDAGLEGSATWATGIVRVAMGEWDDGVIDCLRAVQVARDVLYRSIATAFLGFAYMEMGDAAQAITALEHSIPLVHRFGLRAYEGWFTAFLAEAHRLAAHFERAEALAESACRIATEGNFPVAVGWAQLSQGRIAAARRDLSEAATRLEAALATFTSTHSRYECARTHMDLAGVWWARADTEVARRHFAAAHQLFGELGVPRYRERLERLAAECGIALETGSSA